MVKFSTSRQHPNNPGLFLCLACGTYKPAIKFPVSFKNYNGHRNGPYMSSRCQLCKTRHSNSTESGKIRRRNWEKVKINRNKKQSNHKRNSCMKLTDGYLRRKIRERKLHEPDQLEIEITRVMITMKRTLREFKKWRKENESDYTDVYGKQQPYEENHEGRVSA